MSRNVTDGSTEVAANLPLSALLSQVLIAFTIELDNEFERRMAEAGYSGALLSLVVWFNLIRFLADGPIPVGQLAAQTLSPENRIKFELGCLERWGFVTLDADPADARNMPAQPHRRTGRILRDGWGSGRGIRSGWIVCLTSKGRKASKIWPPLLCDIEQRWRNRFDDDEIHHLRLALENVAKQFDLELPWGVPLYLEKAAPYPVRRTHAEEDLPLPVLLSQLLLAFTIDFDRESPVPLKLCANTLRVLGTEPIPVSDIPRLTGASSETSGVGWQIKPYITVERNASAGRGTFARLTPRGLHVQQTYRKLTEQIEKRWQTKFGKDQIISVKRRLQQLFIRRNEERLLLADGLIPAEGTVRAGVEAPALGRRDIGTAARRRARDLAVQTEMFVRDPRTLPHYPLWDMNRGFGP